MGKCFFLGALLVVSGCHGGREPAVGGTGAPAQPLRLEAVRFYEAGIGYFERAGTVSQADAPTLFVPDAHLDDALRTLVVFSGNRAVKAEFASTVPPEVARVRARPERALDQGPDRRRRYRALNALAERGPLRIGYVTETPLWEPTYRLFLSDSEAMTRLVGSALVHNDTDEPWTGVRVTFASDRPSSNVYDFSFPAYLYRRRVERASEESLLPQLGVETPESMLDGPSSSAGRTFPRQKYLPSAPERLPERGSFEYRAPRPLDVRARGSALVPFFDRPVPVRAIVWATWQKLLPMRALRIDNPTEQTLPSGALSAVAPNGFAGEVFLPRLLPREHAFVELAEELDVSIDVDATKQRNFAENVWFEDSLVGQTWREEYERTWVIENRKATPVTVYVWLPFEQPPIAQGFDRIEDGDTNAPVGILEVRAKARITRKVTLEARSTRHATIDELLPDDLRELAKASVGGEAGRALLSLASLVERIGENATATAKVSARIEDIDSALESVRSDLSSLGGASGPAADRIVTRLLAIQAERTRALDEDRALREEGERLHAAQEPELARLPKPESTPFYVRRSVRKK